MSNKPNLVAKLYGKEDLRIESHPIPKPRRGEVLLALQRCGMCATDLHLWQQGGGPGMTIQDFIVIGHESSGVVVAVGEGVTSLKEGDRVVPELGLPCRTCDFCKRGRYNLCKPYSLGGFANYLVYPDDFCHKIPDHVSYDVGALLEPMAVAVRATRRSRVSIGTKVLVCGAGPVGLCCVMSAKSAGASDICVTDVDTSKLELARRLGATHTVRVTGKPVDTAVEVKAVLGDCPDVALECSGVESALTSAIRAVRPGGVVTVVSIYAHGDVTIPVTDITVHEVDLRGVFSYCKEDYQAAIAMVASGSVDPTPMISHRFTLPNVLQAIELLRKREPGVVKIMVDVEAQ